MKLKYRLSISFLVVVALGAVMTFIPVQRSTEALFRSFVFSGDSAKAEVYASLLEDYWRTEGEWDDVQSFLHELPVLVSERIDTRLHGERGFFPIPAYPASTFRALLADRVVVADANGVIVADTSGELIGTVHPFRHISHGVPVTVDSGRKGTVLVGSMIDSSLTGIDERFLDSVTLSLAFSTGVSVLVALLLGILFTVRITKPLASLAAAARSVSSGDLSGFVPVEGHDELSELSASFNEMTAELKRLDKAKKQVIADSSDELRTQFSLIQGTIEGLIDGIFPLDIGTLKSVHEETLRLSRLIDTLRELESIDSGELRLSPDGVDLREMATRAISLFAPSAAQKSIALALETVEGGAPIANGDYLRLGEVVYNLLSNAIKYTPPGGHVRVREEPTSGGQVRFTVDDSGPGIEASERARVFERFYRIDKSRATDTGGRGLGLSIVSEIVKAHGGTVTVGASDLGGASFAVSLPRFAADG